MNDMKCPFCQQELNSVAGTVDCTNFNCIKTRGWYGNKELWQELICIRKALKIALDWLGQVATPEKCDDDLCREFTKRKLAEIKIALEQKDVK